MTPQSCAILLPNNEFLSGQNGAVMQTVLNKISVFLNNVLIKPTKVCIVSEESDCVCAEVKTLSKSHDVVIILFKNIDQSGLCKLSFSPIKSLNSQVPYFQRIFVLHITRLEQHLAALEPHLRHYNSAPRYSKVLIAALNGNKILEELRIFGDLDVHLDGEYLRLTSPKWECVIEAEKHLRRVVEVEKSYFEDGVGDSIYRSEDFHIKEAIKIIEKCLTVYGLNNVFLSFNGGKDCTVLLHMILTIIHKKYPEFRGKKLFCLYVRNEHTFKEQDEFLDRCRIYYNLEIATVTGNIKHALELTIRQNPQLKACFMGTRRTDPFCQGLSSFQMTDSDWPQVMRVSPFLDWHFNDIWDYLLYYKIPYCKLYDLGYTSLGSSTNTIRNPSLVYELEEGREEYLPAYKLLNQEMERSGRNVSKI